MNKTNSNCDASDQTQAKHAILSGNKSRSDWGLGAPEGAAGAGSKNAARKAVKEAKK